MKIFFIFIFLLPSFSFSESITFRDIERKCEVWRWSENWGDVECRGSKMRFIERSCEAYFWDASDEYGDIECSGSSLRNIERRCSVWMYSETYGSIEC